MREKWVFTDTESAWIEDKFHNDPEVTRRMNDTTSSSAVMDAAFYLDPLFQKEFTAPYAGETEKEFSRRKANMSDQNARKKAQRIPPETQQHFDDRMADLPKVRI